MEAKPFCRAAQFLKSQHSSARPGPSRISSMSQNLKPLSSRSLLQAVGALLQPTNGVTRCLRHSVRALPAIATLFTLSACASSQVPYVPSVSFECRLTVWPTFESPTEFLVQKDSLGRSTITEFRYRGAGGYTPKRSGAPIVHVIDSERWKNFTEDVRKHDPWTIPTQQPYRSGLDGTTMILEIREGDRYHRVQRWVPFAYDSEKKFVAVSTAVIKLLPER